MLDNHTGLAPTMSVSAGLETVHSQLLCPVFIQEAISRMSCEHSQCPLRVSGLLQWKKLEEQLKRPRRRIGPSQRSSCLAASWQEVLLRVQLAQGTDQGANWPLYSSPGARWQSLAGAAGRRARRAPHISGYFRYWEHLRVGRAILVTRFPQKYMRISILTPTLHCPIADGPPWVFNEEDWHLSRYFRTSGMGPAFSFLNPLWNNFWDLTWVISLTNRRMVCSFTNTTWRRRSFSYFSHPPFSPRFFGRLGFGHCSPEQARTHELGAVATSLQCGGDMEDIQAPTESMPSIPAGAALEMAKQAAAFAEESSGVDTSFTFLPGPNALSF